MIPGFPDPRHLPLSNVTNYTTETSHQVACHGSDLPVSGIWHFLLLFFFTHNKARGRLCDFEYFNFLSLQIFWISQRFKKSTITQIWKCLKKSLEVSFCFGTRWPAANFITLRLKQVASWSSVVGDIRQRKALRVHESRNHLLPLEVKSFAAVL